MMERVSIISSDDGYCNIFVRSGEDVIELAGRNNPWRKLFEAILKMKVLKSRKYIQKVHDKFFKK
jgi:hypothetical protein